MSQETIVAAIDPNAQAEEVVATAADLAKRMGTRVVLVHVLPVSAAVDADVFENPAAHPAATALLKEQAEAAAPRLQQLAAIAQDQGVPASVQVVHGEPVQAIVDVAAAENALLLVTGTHGRSGFLRIALGSVAESLIRAATVPVVTVRMGAADTSSHDLPLD